MTKAEQIGSINALKIDGVLISDDTISTQRDLKAVLDSEGPLQAALAKNIMYKDEATEKGNALEEAKGEIITLSAQKEAAEKRTDGVYLEFKGKVYEVMSGIRHNQVVYSKEDIKENPEVLDKKGKTTTLAAVLLASKGQETLKISE